MHYQSVSKSPLPRRGCEHGKQYGLVIWKWFVLFCQSSEVSILGLSGYANRGLMAPHKKSGKAGAQRTAQFENWEKPSGGTDFLIERTGEDFREPIREAA
jgi:hypothetical protein